VPKWWRLTSTTPEVEELELEDLQGIYGRKALRVTIADRAEVSTDAEPVRPSTEEIEHVLTGDSA